MQVGIRLSHHSRVLLKYFLVLKYNLIHERVFRKPILPVFVQFFHNFYFLQFLLPQEIMI